MRGVLLGLFACFLLPQQDFSKDALTLGRTHDQALYDAFVAGYQLTPSGVVDRVEVITEFRRAVMLVRERTDQGDYSFNANNLASALAPYRGLVGVIADIRLHPLHTFTQAPSYDFYVQTGPRTKPIAASGLKRTAIYPPGMSSGSAIVAVRLEGAIDRAELSAAAEPLLVIVDETGNVLWSAHFDVSRFR